MKTKHRLLIMFLLVLGFLIYLGEHNLALAVAGFSFLYRQLWIIEVKLNALLDDKGIQITEEDFER